MSMVRELLTTAFRKTSTLDDIVADLRREESAVTLNLASALLALNGQITSPDEESWIGRIESLRKELSANSTRLSLVDYGASSDPSTQEQGGGKVVTRTIGETCKSGSMPKLWAFLMFRLVREFRPSACLELGTSLGISTAYQAAALELNGCGRIVTLEGAEALAVQARSNLERLGLTRAVVRAGRFENVLEEVLRELKRVDLAFVDGNHEEHATLAYFDQIYPFLSDPSVVVFDDISWSEGMGKAWKTIVADNRIRIAVDVSKLGVCVIGGSSIPRRFYQFHLSFWRQLRTRMGCS